MYLQKIAIYVCKKYKSFGICGAQEVFVSMAIILIAFSINQNIPKLEHPTPI